MLLLSLIRLLIDKSIDLAGFAYDTVLKSLVELRDRCDVFLVLLNAFLGLIDLLGFQLDAL